MTRSWVFLAALVVASGGCASTRPYVWADDLPRANAKDEPTIRAGDHLYLLVKGQEALTGEIPVRADGTVVHPVFGLVDVAGLTLRGAARAISERLRNIVLNADVTVALAVTFPYKVSVVGEVTHPGPLELDPNEGVLQALGRAGGFTEFANRDGIYVLRQQPANERVRFRYSDLVGGDAPSLAFRLRDGDVLVVE